MIGTALKKYADAHGMTCDAGYVYGKVNHRYIALVDGVGIKMLQIYICPPFRADDEILTLQVRKVLEDCDAKEYRLIKQNAVNIGHGRAVVVFQDGMGAMARIERYIDRIIPRLDALETGSNACACCGAPMGKDVRHVLLDDYILPVHAVCVHDMLRQTDAIEQAPHSGSIPRGILGATLGAIIGAIPWAIVYILGYVAGVVGLLIGFLSNFFYGKLGGKQGRARLAIVILALILGIFLGEIAGITADHAQYYKESGGFEATGLTKLQYIQTGWEQTLLPDQEAMLGNMYDRMLTNIPAEDRNQLVTREEFIQASWDTAYLSDQAELRTDLLSNLGTGLLFGLLGCLSLFNRLKRETKRRAARQLK